jgi:hypothetical protein
VFLTNKHLLVLDGHGSHVTLEAIKHAQEFGLNTITLPSHMSHALQPLNVFCFKPFKTTFKKVVTMSRSNHMEPNKITVIKWVYQALEQSITNKNIRFGFKANVYCLSIPKQHTTRLDLQKYML